MVKGTIFSFVVAAVFFVCFILTMNYIYAILCVFMAMFGVVLVLLEAKERNDKNRNIEEDTEDESYYENDDNEETKPIEAVASV